MAIPEGWETARVEGTFLDATGAPKVGRIHFRPRAPRLLTSDKVIISETFTKTLDSSGYFFVDLPVTNDPDVSPLNFTYEVREDFKGGSKYNIAVALGAGTLNIHDLAPVAPNNGEGLSPLTRLEYESLLASKGIPGGITPLDSNGKVSNVYLPPLIAEANPFTPEYYGAVGNGVADDRVFIQNAIDYAKFVGGGQVICKQQYGWTGVLTVKNGVTLVGNKTNGLSTVATADADEFTLKALDATSQLQVGDWATDNWPGGLRDVLIHGNNTGVATGGLIRYECVYALCVGTQVIYAGGDAHFLDGAQNNTFVACDTILNLNGTAWHLDRGAGGNAWFRCEGNSNKVSVWFDDSDGSSTGNAYAFGPADNTFYSCIFENLDNTIETVIKANCGNRNRFVSCDIVASGGVMSAGSSVMLTNPYFGSAITEVQFDSVHFAAGDVATYNCVSLDGLFTRASFTGHCYASGYASIVTLLNGSPFVSMDCTWYNLGNIPVYTIGTGGGTANATVSRVNNWDVTADPDLTDYVLRTRRLGDAGSRFRINKDGVIAWRSGADNIDKQVMQYDATNDQIAVGAFAVAFRFARRASVGSIVTVAGSTVTIDTHLNSVYSIQTQGSGTVTTCNLSNPSDGARLTIMYQTSNASALTWPTDVRFVGGAAPATPAAGKWAVVEFTYVGAVWVELHRSEVASS